MQPSELKVDAWPCGVDTHRREEERRSPETSECDPHPVNGLRVCRDGQFAVAFNHLQAGRSNPLKTREAAMRVLDRGGGRHGLSCAVAIPEYGGRHSAVLRVVAKQANDTPSDFALT